MGSVGRASVLIATSVSCWVAAGCHSVGGTGAGGMEGRVVDADGHPVQGLKVETEEHGQRTDAEGRFAVHYKAPAQYVHFERGDAWYVRRWRGADDPTQVEIRVPATVDRELVCLADQACAVEATWTLGEAFKASAKGVCEPGGRLRWSRVPANTPAELRCTAPGAAAPLKVTIDTDQPLWRLRRAPVAVRITVRGPEGPAEGCRVVVGGVMARPEGDVFVAEAAGVVEVQATCGGWPAVPVLARVTEPTTLELEWTGRGTHLVGGEVERPLTLLAEPTAERPAGWKLTVPLDASGRYHLPPLDAGRYRVVVGPAAALVGEALQGEWAAREVLIARPVADGETAYVGAFELSADRADGPLPLRWP